jgi:hypothetical protein
MNYLDTFIQFVIQIKLFFSIMLVSNFDLAKTTNEYTPLYHQAGEKPMNYLCLICAEKVIDRGP